MPTYTYQCHSCAYLFEKEQKITDPPLTTCPKCGGPVKTGLLLVGWVLF
ncbi:MAG: Zinc ribbon domain protein [Candidatus Methanoperedenaceae archaeon GB50]|nr:MAG: Zinc ribbon domain protein [Candidatus Methanoperedenaceae archaeon GB50]